jgi:hypothetical protein
MSELAAPAPPVAPPAGSRPEAAAAVWPWRRRAADPDAVRRAAAAQRRKGVIGGLAGALVALLLWQWRPTMALVVLVIATLLTLLALVSPLGGFRRVSRALEVFARGVGIALTWVLMTVVYYGLFLPVGLLLRARGRLRLRKGLDPGATSYWTPVPDRQRTLESYRRQF